MRWYKLHNSNSRLITCNRWAMYTEIVTYSIEIQIVPNYQ